MKSKELKNELICGDCLDILPSIPDKSIDMVFADMPYGTTQNTWDCLIPLEPLWAQLHRVTKKNGCIALWAQAPFSHVLAVSNLKNYRYEWVIEKTNATGHLNAKRMPMKAHEVIQVFAELEDSPETIQIFYEKLPCYNPQKTTGHEPVHSYTHHTDSGSCYGKTKSGLSGGGSTERYPRDVLFFKWDKQTLKLHSTQKPLEPTKYMIETYTNEGDVVLDFCMGSNTTGVACKELGRRFIGIEKDEEIFCIGKNRWDNTL